MKKWLVLSLMGIMFFSCKKDKSDITDNITGTWYPVKTTYIESRFSGSDVVDTDTFVFVGQTGEYLAISTGMLTWRNIESGTTVDGTVWYGTEFESWNTSYVKSGEYLTIGEGSDKETYKITKLTNSQMSLEYSTEAMSGSIKYTTYGNFEFKK